MIYGAWFLVGEMAAAVVFLLSFPAIMLAGCVATVARSAWLHRYTVFTNMKSNVERGSSEVEHLVHNQKAGGSNPPPASILPPLC